MVETRTKIKIEKLAYSLIGRRLKLREKKEKYEEFEKWLKSARMPVSYDMYISTAIFFSIISGFVGIFIGFLFSQFVIRVRPAIKYPQVPPLLVQHGEFVVTFVLSIIVAAVTGGIVYALFYSYPKIKADERRREINRMLPHAINFMYALSRGNANIIEIIKSLAKHEETYGEVAKEFQFVVRNMEFFGLDLRSALLELQETTPSDALKEFISGLLTTIDSGGDIALFLAEKSEQHREKARIEQKGFLETLSLLAETYVTVIVAMPLFMLIVEVIMLAMGTGSMRMVYSIAYLMLPVGSAMFIAIIHMITPSDVKRVPILKEEHFEESDVRLSEEDKRSEVYKRYMRAKRWHAFREALKNPVRSMRENPLNTLYLTVPIALAYVIFSASTSAIIPAIFIVFLPLSVFHEMKRRYENKIKKQTPDFLKELAGTTATGATLQQSIDIISKAGSGGIYKEVERMKRDIEWGTEIVDAFARFANRIKVASLSRVVTLLMETIKIGGDITEALYLSAKDSDIERTLSKERMVNMLIYVIIIYIAFFVFIGIIYMLFKDLLPALLETSVTSTVGGVFQRAAISREEITSVLTQATTLQAIFAGLMAGQMGEGDILAGLKHSLIMLVIVWVMFTFFI